MTTMLRLSCRKVALSAMGEGRDMECYINQYQGASADAASPPGLYKSTKDLETSQGGNR